MAKQITLKITSAVSIGGKIIGPNKTVTLDEPLAKNLLHRGRAVVFTIDEDEKPIGKMTAAELKAVAQGLNIEGADAMNKADLLEAIQKAEEAKQE
ncbi:Rho termination factor N-terminal domain-containing protein [uncultured Tateyamaria sp.]|uniref:Rho termination factor N-terminal domain-containing protein n=1 Tax=uncultured Tateyamaria sp. TaxID=455651 RepID=UPI00261B283E|nr:Rho termination factor N-terminal domain-containing protein [uncultured Tateyamaria sp.]